MVEEEEGHWIPVNKYYSQFSTQGTYGGDPIITPEKYLENQYQKDILKVLKSLSIQECPTKTHTLSSIANAFHPNNDMYKIKNLRPYLNHLVKKGKVEKINREYRILKSKGR